MTLVERKDLQFGRNGAIARLFANLAMRTLGINKVNGLYTKTLSSGENVASDLLLELGTEYTVCDKDICNIPSEGGVIIISNHPTGALDGVILIDLLSKIRPDVKFMGNFLLNRIESLSKYFISVDPFDSKDQTKNLKGVRDALRHVRNGGALVIFPAGEVATWQKGFGKLKDKRWSDSIIRFIRKADVPVLPICIEGRNSMCFRLVGKIHPMLRTAMLPREFVNKRGKKIYVNIASPIIPRKVEELTDMRVYGDYLRANIEYLHKKTPGKRIRIIPKKKTPAKFIEEVAPSPGITALTSEMEAIRQDHLMFSHVQYDIFFAHPNDIPMMMTEIGRMREITFRGIGEGTMKAIDTDFFDTYYYQLFIWDREAQALVGAYRLGMGDEIVSRFGLKGFYVNSLFKMKKRMIPIMSKTIELGRSFVTEEYQRKPVSLMLLWRGILYVLLKHEQYRNLLGPVTISGEFDKTSKTIIVAYLKQQHLNNKLARYVKPITGLEGINAPIDTSLIKGVKSIDLINKLIIDIERHELSIPILIKKYLQLNSHVLAFNVDHDFSDALDALMLLDLKKMPDNMIALLSKEITDIDVVARFKAYEEPKKSGRKRTGSL